MKPKSESRSICVIIGFCILASPIRADDWPQWRGPQRNGSSKETGLLKTWPKEGPKLLWKAADVGSGYSTPAVVGEHLYLLANEGMESEFVQSHSIKNGSRMWKTRLGNVGLNDLQANYAAARSTPTVDSEFLYALGSDGDLVAVQIDNGAVRWKKSLRKDFGGQPGDWAYAESPLIDGDTLVCTPGGEVATILAMNKKTGDVIWKCAVPEADQAAFASPILVETAGIRQYVQLLQKGLVGIDAKTGKFLWRYAKPVSRYGANIPTPVESNGYIYVGSAGTGGGSVRLNVKDGRPEPEELYFGSKFPTAIGGVVNVEGFVYGTKAESMLCFELVTGKVKWEERALGAASICYVDGHLYLHGENGEVALVEASTESYREKGRFTPRGQPERTKPMEKAWAYPVVANGRLYIRDHGSLWCYDVEGKP